MPVKRHSHKKTYTQNELATYRQQQMEKWRLSEETRIKEKK